MSVEFDSWRFIVHLCGFCEGTCSYLALFKLISTKCRHTGLDSSSTESYQHQANHAQCPRKRRGWELLPKCEILRSRSLLFPNFPLRTRCSSKHRKGTQSIWEENAQTCSLDGWMEFDSWTFKLIPLSNNILARNFKVIAWILNKNFCTEFFCSFIILSKRIDKWNV